MDVKKSNKNPPKYDLPEKVVDTGQTTLDSIDDILGEDFSVEESLFWGFQRWLWATLKIISVFGIIVFFIWVIWTPERILKSPKITIPEKLISKIKLEKIPQIPPDTPSFISSTKDVILAAQWNDHLKNSQILKQKNLPINGLIWVKQAAAFFDIPAKLFVNGDSPSIRQRKIESALLEIEKLLNKSQEFQKNFNSQIQQFAQNIEIEKKIAIQKSKEISEAFSNANAIKAEQSLFEKITAEQNMANLANKMKWHKTILFEIEKYDRGLRSFHENIVANKAALIQNIQVVNFPNDPFARTISPAEWRETSGN